MFVYIPAVHNKLLSLKRGNNGNMVAGHLGNWGKLPSSQAKTSECTAVSGTCQARRRNKSDGANCRFASPHSEKLQRPQKKQKKKRKRKRKRKNTKKKENKNVNQVTSGHMGV